MNARELRQKFLEFFESKGHLRHPSGSLIPYDVTGRLDESLLFNGAGMVQFKPYFRGIAQPPSKRLTNVQKCVRTGDIEEIGDLTHLSFFEMLGNFSFGDYFKKEAIAYSWEFMTSPEWLGLDPKRLSFTVHEEDDESYSHWSEIVSSIPLDPSQRIFRLDEETNFWPAGAFSKGPPGPCGPNTEMFYWTPHDEPPPSRSDYSVEDWRRDEAAGKWLEIWNDVFIQYEWKGRPADPGNPSKGWIKEGMDPLPFQSVDTGMGVERTATALGGFQSIYAIDVFEPVFRALAEVLAERADAADPAPPDTNTERLAAIWSSKDEDASPHSKAARVIADHARSACFCIADGILPGNSGRSYVLRRLIRRAVLKGQRTLGIAEPFLHRVYEGVAEALSHHYTELAERRETIVETLRSEEELFRRTLRSGSDMLQEALTSKPAILGGETAFKLYDTYGFPLEVTQELCREAGIEVDLEGFDRAMKEAQERSRAAHGMESVYGGVEGSPDLRELFGGKDPVPTQFVGYERTEAEAMVLGAGIAGVSPARSEAVSASDGEAAHNSRGQDAHDTLLLVLDQTPFYVESGGEVSDTGTIQGDGFRLQVVDMRRQDGVYLHVAEPEGNLDDPTKLLGQKVRAIVDGPRRRSITRNHTATHLLHAALRETLGKHVTQAGSLVAPDHLRFDFTHTKALTPDEIERVEWRVNEWALAGVPVAIQNEVPIEEAKKRGAMALFGEKYGDTVRTVEVSGFSLELCGGCHVVSTAEIGLFKILRESSAASGVRRIEAVTGERAYEWARELEARTEEAAQRLKTNPTELVHAIEKLQEQLREERRRLERLRTQAAGEGAETVAQVGTVELATQKLEEGDMKEATLLADRLVEGKPNRVAFVALAADGKVQLVAKAGPNAVEQGAHAGNLVREAAQVVGGGGGGKSDFATAGGRDPAKVDEALAALAGWLEAQLRGTSET
jgi:alanyl-tRNA synthetase